MLKSTLIDVSALSIKPTPDYFMLKFTLEAKITDSIPPVPTRLVNLLSYFVMLVHVFS